MGAFCNNINLLIIYYLWKKLSNCSNAQKTAFHAFSLQLCSTTNSKFSFHVSLCEINSIKIQTVSLASKSIYFSIKKHVVSCNNWYWACSEILSYSRLIEIRLYEYVANYEFYTYKRNMKNEWNSQWVHWNMNRNIDRGS